MNNNNRFQQEDIQRTAEGNKKPPLFSVTKDKIVTQKPIDMNGYNIKGLKDPEEDTDAVSYTYLQQNYISGSDLDTHFLPLTGGTMKGDINMNGHKITNVKLDESKENSAATVGYVTQKAKSILEASGLTVSSSLIDDILNKIKNIEEILGMSKPPEGSGETELPVKESLFLEVTGGKMTGNLDMGNTNTVVEVPTPDDDQLNHAANMAYLLKQIKIIDKGYMETFNGRQTIREKTPLEWTNAHIVQVGRKTKGNVYLDHIPTTDRVISLRGTNKLVCLDEQDPTILRILRPGRLVLTTQFNVYQKQDQKGNFQVILCDEDGDNERVIGEIKDLRIGYSRIHQKVNQPSKLKIVSGDTAVNVNNWSWKVEFTPYRNRRRA